jgi:hypothetical protein
VLGHSDVGRRVVVRRRLDVIEGRQFYGDVLGDLVSWADGVLVLRKRDGSLVSVNEADVVAGKPIPPPPAPRVPRAPHTGETLARMAASGWPAVEIESLGDWWLQAADGFTGRANSVQPSGSPGMPLDEALERVQAFYAARGLPAWIQVVVDSPLESSLISRGWVLQTSGKAAWATTEVWVCQLPALVERLAELGVPAEPSMAAVVEPVVEFGGLEAEWERLYGRSLASKAAHHVLTGGDGAVPVALARLRSDSAAGSEAGSGAQSAESSAQDSSTAESAAHNSSGAESSPQDSSTPESAPQKSSTPESAPHNSAAQDSAPHNSCAEESSSQKSSAQDSYSQDSAPQDSSAEEVGATQRTLIAIGRGVVTGPWLGLAAIEVAPEYRRRGLAQRIMAGLARWGADAGARWAYLQFGEENAPARALYEKLGFRPDHKYRYYAPPAD